MDRPSKIRKVYDGTVSTMSFIGAGGIIFLMVIIMIDVLGRNLLNQPFTGTPEIVRNMIVGITFLQLAHVLKNGRHIRSTVLVELLPPWGQKALNIFANLAGLLLFCLVIYSTWTPTWAALENGSYEGEGSLRIPTFPAYLVILIGSLFMVLQFAVSIYDEFTKQNHIVAESRSDTTSTEG